MGHLFCDEATDGFSGRVMSMKISLNKTIRCIEAWKNWKAYPNVGLKCDLKNRDDCDIAVSYPSEKEKTFNKIQTSEFMVWISHSETEPLAFLHTYLVRDLSSLLLNFVYAHILTLKRTQRVVSARSWLSDALLN